MFWTVWNPISGRNRPNAIKPASAAERRAPAISRRILKQHTPVRPRVSGDPEPRALSKRPWISAYAGMSGRSDGTTRTKDELELASDLLDFGAAEDALWQENPGDRQDGERGNILVVDRKIGRPEGFD